MRFCGDCVIIKTLKWLKVERNVAMWCKKGGESPQNRMATTENRLKNYERSPEDAVR